MKIEYLPNTAANYAQLQIRGAVVSGGQEHPSRRTANNEVGVDEMYTDAASHTNDQVPKHEEFVVRALSCLSSAWWLISMDRVNHVADYLSRTAKARQGSGSRTKAFIILVSNGLFIVDAGSQIMRFVRVILMNTSTRQRRT